MNPNGMRACPKCEGCGVVGTGATGMNKCPVCGGCGKVRAPLGALPVWSYSSRKLHDGRWEVGAERGDGMRLSIRHPDRTTAERLLAAEIRKLDALGAA